MTDASNAKPEQLRTDTNGWVCYAMIDEPMCLDPDPKMLDAFPTDWRGGGPWVMWEGTPFAHVMVPVSPTKAASSK